MPGGNVIQLLLAQLYQRDVPTAAPAFGTVAPTGPSYCCYYFWYSCTNGTFLLLLLLLAQLYQRDLPTAATAFGTVVPMGRFYCCFCFWHSCTNGTFLLLLLLLTQLYQRDLSTAATVLAQLYQWGHSDYCYRFRDFHSANSLDTQTESNIDESTPFLPPRPYHIGRSSSRK